MHTVHDPSEVLEVFLADSAVHPYGIADVEQLWAASRWWRDGRAVVGLLELAGSALPVLYAVTARAGPATTNLVARLVPVLPDRYVATGPLGLSHALRSAYRAAWSAPHLKMHLADVSRLPSLAPEVVVLGPGDLPALRRLYDSDPRAGDFFHPGLLRSGHYLGRWEDGALVATAGIHVIERRHGVAAIGNVATHPAYRRRGFAREVLATLCHRLRAEAPVVGLNVGEDNTAARRLYETLGFAPLITYEEAQLIRR